MRTEAKPDFWDSCRRFFTFKTEAQLTAEAEREHTRVAIGSQASGIQSFIDEQKQEIAKLEARTNSLLRDMADHFRDYGVYLKPEFGAKSKFENINSTCRRFAIKWFVEEVESDFRATIAFVFTETGEHSTRVDYIYNYGTNSKEVINDDLTTHNWTYKDEDQFTETFRRVVRHETYSAFEASTLPQWFKDVLDRHVKALR